MRIEVVYASPDQYPHHYRIDLEPGSDCSAAIEACGVLRDFPEIRFDRGYGIAVFGKRASWHSALEEGDRVEILRPLGGDPKDVRRARAKATARSKRSA